MLRCPSRNSSSLGLLTRTGPLLVLSMLQPMPPCRPRVAEWSEGNLLAAVLGLVIHAPGAID
jgi:hypothetical protein